MQWIVQGRFTFDGHAIVEADSEEEAQKKFDSGDFEFDAPTASCCDWERRGSPQSDE